MEIETYGTMPDGTEVRRFTLSNRQGAELSIIEYGATITDLLVPDSEGNPTNVVLGYRTLEDYMKGDMFFGATVGRVAGRITDGRFTLGGEEYELEVNDPPNHLHGGSKALDKRIWSGEPVESEEGESVVFRYRSPDNEQGYPGTVDFEVQFSLAADAPRIRIDYHAETDEPTPISMTNHAYFNLDGPDAETADDNRLMIDADEYVPCDEDLTLQGRVEPVEGKPVDLREPKRLGEVIPRLHLEHGDNYMVRRTRGDRKLKHVARASSSRTDIELDVSTTADCLQFFGGQYIDPEPPRRDGTPHNPRAGFCLETQEYPDGVNDPEICDIITTPDDPYTQTTIWEFSADQE